MLITFRNKSPDINSSTFIAPNATVIGNVSVGENSGIWFGAVIRGDSNSIQIGSRTNIQDLCVIHVDDKNRTEIGNDVTVGHRAILHGCKIQDRVIIGMGATVMNGAVIGSDSIVGAGALVTEGSVIPPGSLVLGVPAKFKRELTEEEIARIMASAKHYAEFAEMYNASLLQTVS